MASRKATKAELAKSVNAGNRKSGVTQSGLPRAGRVTKPTKTARKTANTVGGKTLAGDESYVPQAAREPLLKGSGPGRSSGLSEDAEAAATVTTRADAMIDSGADFNPIPTQKDVGVSVLEPKKAVTPQQKTERKAGAKVTQGRQRKSVIEGVQSGRISTDLRSAEARQRFFTDDVDTSPAAVEAAAVTGGKLPVKQSKIRTANPPQGFAVTGRDASGKLKTGIVTRANTLGKTKPLSQSVDKETTRNKREAQTALKAGEAIQSLDEVRQGPGSTGRGAPVEGMTKDAVYTTGTAPTESDIGKPYQMTDITGGSTAAVGGKVEATTRTAQTAVGRDEALASMTTAEKDSMGKPAQQIIKGSPARTGGYIGGTVGSSEITPEFRANVAKTVAADSKTAIPEDIQDEQGYSLKSLLSDRPDIYESISQSVAKSTNRRSSLSIDPQRQPKDSRGSKDAPVLEGNDWQERLDSHLATVNPTKRKDIEDQLIAAGLRPNAPISEAAEKSTKINGITVRASSNDAFGKMASANKAVATEVATSSRRRRGSTRTAPVEAITEQSGKEAARTFAIDEKTNKIIANEYMQPPSTKPSRADLQGRKVITDPATGQPVTGKGVIAASQRIPLTGEGVAQPTSAQLKIMQTTQPRLAPVFDRRPGQPGAMSITTASGDVGSVPIRANDADETEDNPWGRGTQTGSVAYPKAARMPGATSVQFQTPSGPSTRGVAPQAMPTASDIAAISTKEPGGRTPWNSLAPGTEVMVNDGSTGPTSMVRSSQFGNIQGSGGVPATPENMRRAAARPRREAGIAAAKPIAESKRYERLAATAKPGVDKREALETVRIKTLDVMQSKNLPVRQEAVAGLAANKPKQPAPLAEGLAPKNVPTVQASTERPNYSREERSQMAAQAQSRRDTLAASMGQRASQADSSDAALAAGVSPFAPKTQAMRGTQFNQ